MRPGAISAVRDSGVRRNAGLVAVLALATGAWLLLAAVSVSPWGGYFSHDALEHIDRHLWETATLAAGWTAMVTAMMLPTIVPLVSIFDRVTDGRPDRARLLASLLGGYVVVWLAAGVAMHGGDLMIHWLVRHSVWLRRNTWSIEAGTLMLAGAYQFSGLKSRCLMRCRSPASFVRRHWRGGNAAAQSFKIGVDNGTFCVGCCWSLMLVMFSVGVGDLLTMAELTVAMVAEKTFRLGHRLTIPIGIWLLGRAVLRVLAG
jgi:predicted metal-binding membrane protein